MAVTPDVTLQSVLGTLTGSTNVTTFTVGGGTVTGTVSVVGADVLIYSPNNTGITSTVIPFAAIDRVIV